MTEVIRVPVPAGDKNPEVAALQNKPTPVVAPTPTPAPAPTPTPTMVAPVVVAKPVVIPAAKPLAQAPKQPTPVNTLPSPSPVDVAVPDGPDTVVPPPAENQAQLTREQRIADLCKQQFLRVQELVDSNFSHRGYCAKCGWQSFQHSAEAAASLVTTHIMAHWKDVVRFL